MKLFRIVTPDFLKDVAKGVQVYLLKYKPDSTTVPGYQKIGIDSEGVYFVKIEKENENKN